MLYLNMVSSFNVVGFCLIMYNFVVAFCSHWRSYQFFGESVVDPHAFQGAVNCESWGDYEKGVCNQDNSFTSPMGLYVDPR